MLILAEISHNVCDRMQKGEMSLAIQVQNRRNQLGLSQQELAEFSGCGRILISQIENGKETIRYDKLLQILDALGLEMEIRER